MAHWNGPGAMRPGDGTSRNLSGMRRRHCCLTTAMLAVAALAAHAAETTIYAGQIYQVVDEYYVDDKGTYWKPIMATTTAYSPTREQCDDTPGETATGSDARREYGVAADPRALPYGTVLRIPGYGDAIVDDTGGDMRRNWARGVVHLDLRIPLRRYDGHWRSEDEATRVALEHGVRRDRIVLMKVTMPVTAAR